MPYTAESLKKYGPQQLKNIFNVISAHKSALAKKVFNKKNYKIERETAIKAEKRRKDLLLGKEYEELTQKEKDAKTNAEKTAIKAAKKAYLIPKILRIQDTPFLKGSKYENEFKDKMPDYSTDFGEIHIIRKGNTDNKLDPESGYLKEDIVVQPNVESEEEEEPEPVEVKPQKEPESESDVEPEQKEEAKEKEAKPQSDGSQTSLSRAPTLLAEIQKYRKKKGEQLPPIEKAKFNIGKYKQNKELMFDEQLNNFENQMESLLKLKPTDTYLIEETQKELSDSLKNMRKNLNEKDKTQMDMMKEKLNEYRIKVASKQPEQVVEDINPSFESTERTSVSQNAVEASFKTLSGDQDIGNVRAIGFIAPSQAAAREEEVIPPPSERAKSLRRFVNFRWVYSTQNSSLGYDSPFQKIEDQENRRKFNYCYLPTNKLPKPETQEDLDKAKSFNTYPLVPQQSLVGMMQPASELSFKTSTNPHARKITIDEKQFADTKLYNFEQPMQHIGSRSSPSGLNEPTQVNIKPTNPFSSMYGMEAIDQIKRNPNNDKNTLEFSSVMYDDCPISRIKRKYNKNVVA